MIIGTPAYMAPEQERGEATDSRCDLFSLGVVLYRLCTGQQPFKGNSIMATLREVACHQPPPPMRLNLEVPPGLSDLVMKLLEKDPQQRPASAGAVVEALQTMELQARRSAPVGVASVEARVPLDQPTQTFPSSFPKVSENTLSVPFKPAPRSGVKAGRGRTLLLIAVALLALVPLGWWLATVSLRVETANGKLIVEIAGDEAEARIKKGKLILTGLDDKVRYTLAPGERDKNIEAGQYKIRVEGADGLVLDTPEFSLKKDGQVTVKVTLAPKAVAQNLDQVKVKVTEGPKAVAQNLDPDRKAAEYVLSIGGTVLLNGQHRDIKAAADLPPEAFRLTGVYLLGNRQVSDAGLAHFKGCNNLMILDLQSTQVTDTGLAHFKDCKNLTTLWLSTTQVTDTGLTYFKDCKNLTSLNLNSTRVSDVGLAHFKDCKNLKELGLADTQVSDVGLAYFKDCKNLTDLVLHATRVSDVGLAYFKDCKNLTALSLKTTQVTAAGVAELHKALPKCKIDWNGGTIQPR